MMLVSRQAQGPMLSLNERYTKYEYVAKGIELEKMTVDVVWRW